MGIKPHHEEQTQKMGIKPNHEVQTQTKERQSMLIASLAAVNRKMRAVQTTDDLSNTEGGTQRGEESTEQTHLSPSVCPFVQDTVNHN